MKELTELREMLCDELKEYGKKGELSAGSLNTIDTLTHTIKNLDKIMEEEGGYSGHYWSYNDGMGNRSYARRRDSMGRYSRDYSRDNGMVGELRELMESAPDERTRQEFHRFIQKLESM